MSWITVTDQDAMPGNSQERQSIAAVKGVDDLQDKVVEAVETFRDAIRSSGQPLDADGTIPLSLKRYVIDWAIWQFVSQGVAKNPGIQDDARKDANDRAEKMLSRILDGKFKVTAADPTQTVSHGVTLIRRGRRMHTGSFDKLGET